MDAAWRAFAEAASASASSLSQQQRPVITLELADALLSAGLASLAADTSVRVWALALAPAIDAAGRAVEAAVSSSSRAASFDAAAEDDGDNEAHRQDLEEEAKEAANAAAEALSALAASASEAKQSLRALLVPLLLSTSTSTSSSSSSSVLSLRSAPARLLAEVSADFAAALSSSGCLQLVLERFYGDRLLELSARAGFDDDDDGEDGEEGLEEEEEENNENTRTDGNRRSSPPAAVLRPNAKREALPPRKSVNASSLMGRTWVSEVAATSAAARLLGASAAADAAAAAAAAAALKRRAAAEVASSGGGSFERAALPAVRAWAAAVPPALLEATFSTSSSSSSSSGTKENKRRWLRRWRALLDAYAHEAVGSARAAQLFDAVVDWPASAPAVDDLRAALFFDGNTGSGGNSDNAGNGALRALVAETFGAETRRRLLHAGAATADVIAQYVSTVRCLRRLSRPPLLPPPQQRANSAAAAALSSLNPLCAANALLLEHRVTAPVRAYLRRRPDAVRCVVGALAGRSAGGGGDNEAAAAGPLAGLLDEDGDDGDDDDTGGTRQRRKEEEKEEEEEAARLAASSAEYGGTGGASDADDDPDEAGRIARAMAWEPPPAFPPRGSSRRGGGVCSSSSLLPAGAGAAAAAAASDASASSSSSGAGGAVSLLASAFGGPDVLIDAFRSHAGRALLACRGGGGGGGGVGGKKAPQQPPSSSAAAAAAADDPEEQPLLVGLELLRARFGDRAALVPVEVMLKDVADSRRLLAAVRSAAAAASRAAKEAAARRRRRQRRGEEVDEEVSTASPAVIPAHLSDAATRKMLLRRVSVLVTSSLFWPRGLLPTETYISPVVAVEEENNGDGGRQQSQQQPLPPPPPPFELPPALCRALDACGAHFTALKAPRKLVWRPTAGLVTLEVEVSRKRTTFSATPLEAALLLKFSDSDSSDGDGGTKAEWHASELAAALKIKGAAAVATVIRAAGRWVGAGLLSVVPVSVAAPAAGPSASDPLYRRASALPPKSGKGGDGSTAGAAATAAAAAAGGAGGGGGAAAGDAADDEDEEPEGPDAAADAATAQMLEAFVLGMLTNFEGGLPTERIHSMLKMFATDPPYEAGVGATAALLARMSREEKVVAGEGSVWRKKSSSSE